MEVGVGEPTFSIFCIYGRQRSSYRSYQRLAHACALLTHEILYLAEDLLYGRKVG
jgi:hypothetical protein